MLRLVIVIAILLNATQSVRLRAYRHASKFMFTSWQRQQNVRYSTRHEKDLRKTVFRDNVGFIMRHNSNPNSTTLLGTGPFSDLTHDEYREIMTANMNGTELYKHSARKTRKHRSSIEIQVPAAVSAPDSVDWRKRGAVTAIKKQPPACPGGNYAFAVAGAIEGQWIQKTQRRVAMSEQEIIDCSGKWGNFGCRGGSLRSSYRFVLEDGGIAKRVDYPGKREEGQCARDAKKAARIEGYATLPFGNENMMKEWVGVYGPVSVCLDASARSFQHYRSGVYVERYCKTKYLNHAALVVGYGREYVPGIRRHANYWIVKNSWGIGWGEKGYMKILRDHNHCGIATNTMRPII